MKEYVSKLLHHCRAAASAAVRRLAQQNCSHSFQCVSADFQTSAEASKIKQAGYHRISAVSTRQFNLNDVSRWTRCLGRQISNCKSLWWKIEAQQKKKPIQTKIQ
ncbi:hypothetical protein Tsp_05656 [Trichinella spiralis]|uniref:hypothetical protein n=1 Tax=Trichinella spiralis TaxID=6334 RepID=UPI0001EFE52A|nr:hypothetical protein Tsp_05656 [Trichinella spiralis]